MTSRTTRWSSALSDEYTPFSIAKTPIEYAPARAGELARSSLDTTKAQQLLGWKPAMPLGEGLERTFRYFADRRSRASTHA